jgi:NAD(P)-dependent dehydrogenase (short-subunit alcohol dehydrogenase family)
MEQVVPSRALLDVGSRDSATSVIKLYGPFTHILYSAGINNLGWISQERMNIAMEYAFEVNCTGFITILSEHRRCFPNQGFSAVAVSSDAARIPMRGSIAYCASKAALNAAVRVAARELAPACRVNAVAPGMVAGTPMTEYIDATIPKFRNWAPGFAQEYERQGTPTGRRATLTEVASTIVWVLTGPDQMTGAIIPINGGR